MVKSRASNTLIWILLALAAAIFVLHARVYWNWTEDDAYITFRYAQNLVRGQGLVFNPGERVEGYSNFSWVLISAAALRAGLDPVTTAKVIGLTAGVFSLFLSCLLARRIAPESGLATLVAPYYLAISPVLVRHSIAGLETSLFAFLLTAGILLAAASGGRLQSALFLVDILLLSVTRPEGPGLAILLLGGRLLAQGGWRAAWRRTRFMDAGCFFLFFGVYFCWRWSYFGSFFPNSFYAKALGGVRGAIDGAQYMLDFLRDAGGPLFVGQVLVPMLLGCANAAYSIALACLVLYLVFIILSGGDWMFHYRFFANTLPVLAACIAAGVAYALAQTRVMTRRKILLLVCAAAVLVGTSLSLSNTELPVARLVLPAIERNAYLSQSYAQLGRWFRENTPPDATIAISDIGAVGYYSERRILDMFGLTDRRIARLRGRMHYKADPQSVLARKPEYVVLVSSGDAGIRPSFLRIPDRVMSDQPEFNARYDLARTVPLYWQNELLRIYKRHP